MLLSLFYAIKSFKGLFFFLFLFSVYSIFGLAVVKPDLVLIHKQGRQSPWVALLISWLPLKCFSRMGSQCADWRRYTSQCCFRWEKENVVRATAPVKEMDSCQARHSPLLPPCVLRTRSLFGCICPLGKRTYLCHLLSWQSIREWPWCPDNSLVILLHNHKRDFKPQFSIYPTVGPCLSKSRKARVGWLFSSYRLYHRISGSDSVLIYRVGSEIKQKRFE